MFGYVKINKPELKIREYTRYKSVYCGLCRGLKKYCGKMSQITLTYDMTFLILLLSSLYEPKETTEKHFCMLHLGKKLPMMENSITEYAAKMNVLLAYYHFQDDWQDEKKLKALLGSKAFVRQAKKIAKEYPNQAEGLKEQLGKLSEMESKKVTDLDEISRPFGELMRILFRYQEDPLQSILGQFAFYLGKYIYLLDAYLDYEEDMKKGCFNPFFEYSSKEEFKEKVIDILDYTRRIAIVEFEKLPLEQDLSILRNILYEGIMIPVWEEDTKGNNYDK